MELNHDWRGFQTVFQPRKKALARPSGPAAYTEGEGRVYLVVDGKRVVAASGADAEDLSSWAGEDVTALSGRIPHREIVIFKRSEVDRWMNGCVPLPHFYEQMEYLREQSVPEAISAHGKVKRIRPVARRHFVLDAIQGWWARILPSAYGVFIRLVEPESRSPREIFVLVRGGRLELFHCPDLSFLGAERSREPAAVVKYLSEKHRVPVQGLVVPAADWAEWSEPNRGSDAWKQLAFAIRGDRAKLVPFRWQVVALGAAKAFLGV